MNVNAVFDQGRMVGIVVPNPAAGANFTAVLDYGKRWRVNSVSFTLTTAVAVAIRTAQITATLDVNIIAVSTSGTTQAASLAYRYLHQRGEQRLTTVVNNRVMNACFGLITLSGEVIIASAIENLQAADQISNIVIFAEEWLEPI